MYDNVVEFIHANIDNLTSKWVNEVTQSVYMAEYKKLPHTELKLRNERVYNRLTDWLKKGASNDNAEQYFEAVGAERLNEGFSLTEIIFGIYLAKRVLFQFLLNNEELLKLINTEDAINLMGTLSNYFDLGSFYMMRGHNNEVIKRILATGKFSKNEVEKLISKGSFDESDLDAEDIIWRHVY